MSTLFNKSPKSTFKELLKIDSAVPGTGLGAILRNVEDGSGTPSPLQLATDKIALQGKLWPTTVGATGSVLRISADTNILEWAPLKAVTTTSSFFPGAISPMVGTIRWYAGAPHIMNSIFVSASTAPSIAITIDLKKNGVSVFGSNPKPTIAPGSNISSVVPLNLSMEATDYLTIDILTGDGSDLAVRIEYQ